MATGTAALLVTWIAPNPGVGPTEPTFRIPEPLGFNNKFPLVSVLESVFPVSDKLPGLTAVNAGELVVNNA